ncbi:histidinol dehydrogenase [Candidatus Poribacteria bacterium]|nr:MAG: histidinol dehydrogenase [Candidatus Poribacteria bacterium]
MLKPERLKGMTPERKRAILQRSMEDIAEVFLEVKGIVDRIRAEGDRVTLEHYRKYKEDITPADLKASREEIERAYEAVDPKLIDHLKLAARNIERFHRAQLEREMWSIEVSKGIIAGRLMRPMEAVGAYVPGRRAAYPSSVLMNVIPAKVAGVEKVIVCTPPDEGMTVNPLTLVAADIAGADEVFKIGGPWAIASMAFGTETVPKVDKIVGPGGIYVTAAKMAVFGHVDIDSPAGPSEILILADESADPEAVAVDLLSQAEHDPDAASVLVTTSPKLAEEVCRLIGEMLGSLPRREIIEAALEKHSAVLIADSMDEAVEFANEYAAEHLEILTEDPIGLLPRIKHAGSIFLGKYAPVPVGDYASGTNHVLPTGRCARMFSGLSVDDFIKKPTFQYLTREGFESLAEAVMALAEAEGLPMHARSVRIRLEKEG